MSGKFPGNVLEVSGNFPGNIRVISGKSGNLINRDPFLKGADGECAHEVICGELQGQRWKVFNLLFNQFWVGPKEVTLKTLL